MRVSTSEFTYKMLSNTERAMRSLKAFECLVEYAAYMSGSRQMAALKIYISSGRTLFTVVRIPRGLKDFFDPSLKVGKDLFPDNNVRDRCIHGLNYVSPFNTMFMGSLVPLAVEAGGMERSEGLGLCGNLMAAAENFLCSHHSAERPNMKYQSTTEFIGGIKYLMESTNNIAQMLGLDPRIALALKSSSFLGLWQSVRQTTQEIDNA